MAQGKYFTYKTQIPTLQCHVHEKILLQKPGYIYMYINRLCRHSQQLHPQGSYFLSAWFTRKPSFLVEQRHTLQYKFTRPLRVHLLCLGVTLMDCPSSSYGTYQLHCHIQLILDYRLLTLILAELRNVGICFNTCTVQFVISVHWICCTIYRIVILYAIQGFK